MNIKCNSCGSTNICKNGHSKNGKQVYRCKDCSREGIVPSSFTDVNGEEQTQSNIGITISEFREKHDLNFIINKALKQLDRKLLYEKTDIAKLCKLTPTYPGLRATLEETKEFESFRGKVAGKIYFGHPETIGTLKNEGQLT